MYIKTCQNCEIDFHTNNRRSLLCDKCKIPKKVYIKKQRIFLEKKCELCSKTYITSNKYQKYCSQDCCKTQSRKKASSMENRHYARRMEIFDRDKFACQYCGRTVLKDKITLQVDHIIPKAKGGKDEKTNLITACEECNLGKKDALLENHRIFKEYLKNL